MRASTIFAVIASAIAVSGLAIPSSGESKGGYQIKEVALSRKLLIAHTLNQVS